jgi:hypothetical protein
VSNRTYRPLQMHRIAYTDLTETQVAQIIKPTVNGPTSRTPMYGALAGRKLRILTDNGPTLDYTFETARALTLAINGKIVKAGYGALQDRQLVLVSHMVPGTLRGYQLVIDQESGLATVFDIYFAGYMAEQTAPGPLPATGANGAGARPAAGPREPQIKAGHRNRELYRNVYFGYVDKGGAAPRERHKWTNRLEGKGIHWQQDNDIEVLEFYLSTIYSNFFDLTRFGGELTVCAPTDYIMVNDHQFIYSRVESEFSGTMSTQIIDLFDVTQKGVRLGINDKDALEYYMYSGKGTIVGQTATFEVFGNNGETRDPGPRRVYRPIETFDVMTDAEVKDQCLNHAEAFGNGKGSEPTGMAGYKGELITKFAGEKLSVKMDGGGPSIDYDFVDGKKLKWKYAGQSNWREAWYEMYEPDDELFFFAHLLDAEWPRSCAMVAIDMKNGLATLVKGTTGTPFRNNEITPVYYFGTFTGRGVPQAPTYLRHAHTDELVGETVTWNYQPGNPGLTSMHCYAGPHTYSWIIFSPDGAGGMQWSSPGWYSKLRDGVYIMAWVEEACNGGLGVILYNRRLMHDAGFGYHVNKTGLSLGVVGARARHAGKFDVKQYVTIQGAP